MKKFIPALAVLALLLLAACAPSAPPAAPPAAPPSAEPSPPAVGPALEVLPGAKIIPADKKLYGITIDGGLARSDYGQRFGEMFALDMAIGDVLKVSVPYGQPAVALRGGGIEALVNPGQSVRLEAKQAERVELKVTANDQQTDTLALNILESLPGPTAAPPTPTPPPAAPVLKELSVEADDAGFYPDEIVVDTGDRVKLTLKVRASGVYFGGLDFRSESFRTEQVAPGGQTTVEFNATKGFIITSYWPSSGVRKADLRVHVNP